MVIIEPKSCIAGYTEAQSAIEGTPVCDGKDMQEVMNTTLIKYITTEMRDTMGERLSQSIGISPD